MVCPHCQHANPDGAPSCDRCGATLARGCRQCGEALGPAANFCSRCGRPTSDAGLRFAQPDAYTPKHLAGRILSARFALEGERKQVTVLFADVKSSMELLADRDPEEARQLLDPVLELMMEGVHRYEGTVNQVMGDGIMALFGAPLAHEDHAVRACYAALWIQDALARAHAAGDPGATRPRVRIGLNSGDVVVRSIGSDLRMDYTAVGASTHLAARMEQLAPPGGILLTAATARLAAGYVVTRPAGPLAVRGVAAPVEAHELVGARPVRSRLDAAAQRGLSPFVGRRRERDAIVGALRRAAGGAGQLVAVSGDPGIGKSRLVREALASAAIPGLAVLEATGLPHTQRAAFLPVIGLLRACVGLGGSEAPADVERAVARHLPPEAAARLGPPILALLGVAVADDAWHGLTADQQRRRIFEAASDVLVAEAVKAPLCVVLEDLQWADADTRAVLDHLVERLPAARLCLLVSHRPEHRPDWPAGEHCTGVKLEPLPAADGGALLTSLLGDAPSVERLRREIAERAAGNPFFLEESVRHAVETRMVAGHPGAYESVPAPGPIQVPDTVQAVLAARIDRLPAEAKHVLQAAAALGVEVPLELLEAVAGLPEERVRQAVADLEAGDFLHRVRLFPDIVYAFRHALTLEVAYGGLLADRRRRLDSRIVECVEGLYAGRLADHVDRLAHHALRAERWDKAVGYCRQAGAQALARSAHRAAAAYFQHALEALAHRPDAPDAVARGVDLRLDLRNALSPLGEYRRIRELLTEAEALAQQLGDPARLGRVSAFLLNFCTLRGEFGRAVDYGHRARELADRAGDRALAVVTDAVLSLAYYGQGRYPAAIATAERNLAALPGDLVLERFGMALLPAVYTRTVLAWALAERGEFERGLAVAREGLAIAERSGHLHSVIFACLGAGTVHLQRGDVAAALAVLERAEALWEQADLPAVLIELAGPLAAARARAGRTDEAVALLDRAVAQAIALRHRVGFVLKTGGLAEAHLAAGRAAEALPLAELYVEIARTTGAMGTEAGALWLLGEAAARCDPPDRARAEKALGEALALARELGMRPLEARCLLALGALGPDAGARAAGARLLAELGMVG